VLVVALVELNEHWQVAAKPLLKMALKRNTSGNDRASLRGGLNHHPWLF